MIAASDVNLRRVWCDNCQAIRLAWIWPFIKVKAMDVAGGFGV